MIYTQNQLPEWSVLYTARDDCVKSEKKVLEVTVFEEKTIFFFFYKMVVGEKNIKQNPFINFSYRKNFFKTDN